MIADLWPTRCGIWVAPFDGATLDAMEKEAFACHAKYSTGPEIWDRVPHNIFDEPSENMQKIKSLFIEKVGEMVGGPFHIAECAGREIIRENGREILPHADRDEGDLSAHIFLSGEPVSELSPNALREINQLGDNAFSLCDPTHLGMDRRLPWEGYYNFWVKPRRGLFVIYPSRLLHFQRPYVGEGRFAQITMFIRFKKEALAWGDSASKQ